MLTRRTRECAERLLRVVAGVAALNASACGRLRYDAEQRDAASSSDAVLYDTRVDVSDAPRVTDMPDASTIPSLVARLHGSGSVFVYDLAVGPEREVYVVGSYDGELRAGAITTATSLAGCFLARFDLDGRAAWLADVSSAVVACESVDVEGDRVAFGGYTAPDAMLKIQRADGRVDTSMLPTGTRQVSQAIVLTRAGDLIDTLGLDASGNDQMRGVDLAADRIFFSGSYAATSPGFGGVLLPDGRAMPAASDHGFLIAYTFPVGAVISGWAQPFAGDSDTIVFGSDADSTGVCASGRYVAQLDIGADGSIEGTASRRGFIASFDPRGTLIAANQDEPINTFRHVIRASGSCVALRSGDDAPPVIVVRMDARTGVATRAEVGAVPTLNVSSDFALATTGDALIPGAYGPGMWTLGTSTETFDARAAIVLRLSADGTASARRVPVSGDAAAQAVGLDADGLVVATSYSGEVDVDGMRITSEGASDVVLVRMR